MMSTAERILRYAKIIAVVGASRDATKSASSVPRVMQERGFRVIPVNPFADTILGERAYKTLADIPDKVDVVNVFRPSADAPEAARQAIAIGARALWLQQGIISDEARRLAENAGLDYVEDRCMAVEAALHHIRVS
ncbi:MAG: CoA-binding protein [Myxococcota bacterium]|nr:CoA-binding protein [Myxococcota bacterium]